MKVEVSWSLEPLDVYAITWARHGQDSFWEGKTAFSVLEGHILREVYEHECEVVTPIISNFTLLPKEYDPRTVCIMWRPLVESGIWTALREMDSRAIEQFRKLREAHGNHST